MVVLSLSIVTFFASEVFEFDVLELDPKFFRERLAADEHSDILKDGLAAVSESGAFTAAQ